MKIRSPQSFVLRLFFTLLASALGLLAQPSLLERLDRGVVAVRSSSSEVFVSWRLLGTDPSDIAFNLYRVSGGGTEVKLNEAPIAGATNFVDTPGSFAEAHQYYVKPILFGFEQAASISFTVPAGAPEQQYLHLPLMRPAGGTTPDGGNFTYSPNDLSVGDLDGDGDYEIVVKWEPSNARDAAANGYSGNTLFDAYTLEGTRLWRIDLGVNVRAGPHDTSFIVYDFDGDGRAEVSIRTAAGSKDGLGNFVADPTKYSGSYPSEPFDHNADYRNSSGRSLVGPEFMTVFDGWTGAELASTRFLPARHPDTDFPTPQQLFDIWGDNFGNRAGRYYPPGVGYLDGQRPSIIWGRGYAGGQSGHPGRIGVAAWNWRDGQLTSLWEFDSGSFPPEQEEEIGGQGSHTAAVADLTGDGRDDIVYGQVWISADGELLSTGWGHGDALHVSNMDPDRPGQQVFQPHESPGDYGPNAISYRDGLTGELIWGVSASGDIGRGVAADIDPRFRGYEMWASGGTGGLYNAQSWVPNPVLGPRGLQVASSKPGQMNHAVWWTGDLLRELLDGSTISKWNWETESVDTVLAPSGIASINGTKSNPNLQVDLFGDWREEVIWRESDNEGLRIYTTTIPTEHRIYTLMHDRQYRTAVSRQNVGYNQPPHPGFFLGHDMAPAPTPNMVTSLSELLGPPAPVFTGVIEDTGSAPDDGVTSDATLVLHGTAEANAIVTITQLGVGVIGATTAAGDGSWTFDYSGTALGGGEHLFTARATDGDGNTGASTYPPFSVTVDFTAPPAAIIEAVISSGDDVIIAGMADPFAQVIVTLQGTGPIGTADADEDGVWALTVPESTLPSGEAVFTAAQSDLAGNTAPASAPYSVDTTLAVPVISGVADDSGQSGVDGITNDQTLVINGTGDPGSSVSVSLSGGGVLGTTVVAPGGTWSFDYTGTSLTDGSYGFTAATAGGSGSGGMSSMPFEVLIDTSTPAVVSSQRHDPVSENTAADVVIFRVTFSEEVTGVEPADFVLTLGGGVSGSVDSVSASAGEVIDVTVSGITGEGSIRLDVPSGPGLSDLAGNGIAEAFVTGESYNRVITGSGVWIRSESGGVWSAQANWHEGIIADGADNAGDFSQLDLDGELSLTLDSPRSLGTLMFGDLNTLSVGNVKITNGGNSANTLGLQVSAAAPVVLVPQTASTAGAILDVGLVGTQGINKQGAGVLVLTQPNSLSGPVSVAGGTLRLEQDATFDASSVSISSGGSRLNIAGGEFSATGTLTVNSGGGSAFIFDGGVGTFAGLATTNSAGGLIRINGGTVTATGVNLPRSNDNNLNFGAGFVVAGGDVTINGVVGLGTSNSNGIMSVEGDGHLVVNGPVRVGDLNNSTRGGAMRVIDNATLVVTDTDEGIILTRRDRNTTVANFDGGLTITERISIGAAGVDSGNATVNVRGGALYLGTGGLVRTGTPTTTINLEEGVLGAKADWSSSVPMRLANGGNIELRAADPDGIPMNITLSGELSGAGAFTKTGGGALNVSGVNTFTGSAILSEGTLNLTGTLSAGGAVLVNGGTLTGTGTSAKSLVLNSGGLIAPGGTAPGSALNGADLLWNDGGRMAYDLASGNRLVLSGALTRGSHGVHEVALETSAELGLYSEHTLGTFASTDFVESDFSHSGLAGYHGAFALSANELRFVITGSGATGEYTHWAYVSGIPPGQRGPEDDPDFDGIPNLLEFVLVLDPVLASAMDLVPTTLEVDGALYPAVGYIRRQNLGGVTTTAQASPALGFDPLLATVEVAVEPNEDGTEYVLVRSTVPLSVQPRQFFRITATLPVN